MLLTSNGKDCHIFTSDLPVAMRGFNINDIKLFEIPIITQEIINSVETIVLHHAGFTRIYHTNNAKTIDGAAYVPVRALYPLLYVILGLVGLNLLLLCYLLIAYWHNN